MYSNITKSARKEFYIFDVSFTYLLHIIIISHKNYRSIEKA